jgi:hypothetical protein
MGWPTAIVTDSSASSDRSKVFFIIKQFLNSLFLLFFFENSKLRRFHCAKIHGFAKMAKENGKKVWINEMFFRYLQQKSH